MPGTSPHLSVAHRERAQRGALPQRELSEARGDDEGTVAPPAHAGIVITEGFGVVAVIVERFTAQRACASRIH
jgi:hypothetical protein